MLLVIYNDLYLKCDEIILVLQLKKEIFMIVILLQIPLNVFD